MSARCATIFTTLATAVLLLSTVGGATPHYIWNASNSVPIGLYRLLPVTKLTVTELVAVRPPDLLAAFLDLNGYLPSAFLCSSACWRFLDKRSADTA